MASTLSYLVMTPRASKRYMLVHWSPLQDTSFSSWCSFVAQPCGCKSASSSLADENSSANSALTSLYRDS